MGNITHIEKYLDIIQELLTAKFGDLSRINSMKDQLMFGKNLFQSDITYLLNTYKEFSSPTFTTEDNNSKDEKQNEDNFIQKRLLNLEEEHRRWGFAKNEGVTIILSVLLGLIGLMGIGHLYLGKTERGIAILLGCILLFWIGISLTMTPFGSGAGIILLLIYFIVFVWQIIDSKNLCREYNEFLLKTGKNLW